MAFTDRHFAASSRRIPIILVPLMLAFTTSCTASVPATEEAAAGGSTEPPTLSGDTTEKQPESLVRVSVEGLPFELLAPAGADDTTKIISASPALIHDAELLTTGHTRAGASGLPGPSLRAIFDDGPAFAAELRPTPDGTITSLEDIPSVLGTVSEDGTFTEVPALTNDVVTLPGSNPDSLYFEPQDASSNGEWAVWREGSAGAANAMPTLDTDDWRVVAWNRATGGVTELASAYLLHGDRFAPRGSWGVAPSTDGTHTYFEAVVPSSLAEDLPGIAAPVESSGGITWEKTVARVPNAEPGNIELLAKGASPVATEEGLLWIEDSRLLQSPNGPLLEVVDEGWHAVALVSDGAHVAVTVANDGDRNAWILVWDPKQERLLAAVDALDSWAQVQISANTLVWGNGTHGGAGRMFLWDVDQAAPEALGEAPGMSIPLVNGDFVAVPGLTSHGEIIWTLAVAK